MEVFKYRAVDKVSSAVTSPMPQPLSALTYLPQRSLQELPPVGFSGNIPSPAVVFRTPVPVQVSGGEALFQLEMESREQILRQIEKEEIRREIIAGEIAAARRRQLEEEVRRELAMERGLGIPMQRPEELLLPQPLNQRHLNIFGGTQAHSHSHHVVTNMNQVHACSFVTNKDKLITLAKPDADVSVATRKAMTPSAVNDSEQSTTSLQKKAKHDWSCELCHITTTSEESLNDHLRGKKHKAKEEALTTPKIGLDPRPAKPNIQNLFPKIIPADIGMLKPGVENEAEQESQGLGGLEMKNETASEKQVGEISTSAKKKFKFWCALCKVHTRSQDVMHSHKVGKKHLANLKKASQKSMALD